jgi:major membrane immunogen (membrane-anchored lipoprotein)
MPATSKAQQRLMGLVKAVQAGDVPKSKVTKKIRQLAKSMKEKDVDKYAGTKHKGLPNKVQSENLKVDVARKYGPKGFIIMLNKFRNTATKIFRDKKDFDKLNINLNKQSDLKKLLYVKTDRVGFVKEARRLSDKEQYDYILYIKKYKPDIWRDLQGNKNVRRLLSKFESVDERKGPCWSGYKQVGMKKGKKGNRVPNCVPEVAEHCGCEHKDTYDVFSEETGVGYTMSFCTDKKIQEAEYQGRKVKLNKPMQGDTAKFKVYVKNDKGNVVKVNFGAKGKKNRIKKSDPARRKSFRARHNCDNPGPKYKARYWSCRKW